jgi:hypothetical protein
MGSKQAAGQAICWGTGYKKNYVKQLNYSTNQQHNWHWHILWKRRNM